MRTQVRDKETGNFAVNHAAWHHRLLYCLNKPTWTNARYIRLDMPFLGQQKYTSSDHGHVAHADRKLNHLALADNESSVLPV